MKKILALAVIFLNLFSQNLNYKAEVYLDFRWGMATKILKWLDLASKKCGVQTKVVPVNSSNELVSQRASQAFKRKRPVILIAEGRGKSFPGVVSPVYVYLDSTSFVNCLTFEEFQTCSFEKIEGLISESPICVSRIKQAEVGGFKIAYFILMLILLSLTFALTFFW